MAVMNFVFPITALHFGPFALALYWRWGRMLPGVSPGGPEADLAGPRMGPPAAHRSGRPICQSKPRWAMMAIEVSHWGSGCTLGDLVSEWLICALAKVPM
jgi:hypothetical protein